MRKARYTAQTDDGIRRFEGAMDRILTDRGVTESERLDVLVQIQSIVDGAVAQARRNTIQVPVLQLDVSGGLGASDD